MYEMAGLNKYVANELNECENENKMCAREAQVYQVLAGVRVFFFFIIIN